MTKRITLAIVALAIVVVGCMTPPPPTAPAVAVGDSVAYLIGTGLPVENDAVGGTTGCDTAFGQLPAASKVMLHSGGHSWARYGEAAWRSCVLAIIDHYGADRVWVATPPVPAAIYCADPAYATAVLDQAGIPHGDLFANPDYELRQRLDDARTWELDSLPSFRPGVHVVDMLGVEHNGCPDGVHLDDAGIADAVARLHGAGF